jgi:hypothetical protein
MRVLTLLMSLMILTSFSIEAKTSAQFSKRFQIIRDEQGKLIGIRDRTLPVKFDVAPYVKMIKSQLLNEQRLMSLRGAVDYEQEVRDLLLEDNAESYVNNPQYEANVQKVVDSLKQLAALNVENVFENNAFKEVVEKFSGKMSDAIMMLDPTMVAVVNNPTYFYTKNVTYKAVTWGLDFAKKRMSSVPMLNTISFVIVQVEKKITERRSYHQNMLLHYLENFSEAELGLTHDEVNLVWSSIYESRIPWYAFWESKAARSNWSKYGVNNFYANFRLATNKLRNSSKLYNQVYDRVDYAFQDVDLNGEKVIINLFDNEGVFHNRPAVAFNYSKPTQIVRKRVMLSLAELGISFVPVSDFIKSTVTNFIKSYYENQRLTEGALYGHFESLQDAQGMNQIKLQYLNPFDTEL